MKLKSLLFLAICSLLIASCSGLPPSGEPQPTGALFPPTPSQGVFPGFQEDVPKKPADSEAPAAGICEQPPGEVVEITALLDNPPSPRCVAISSSQKLMFLNGTGSTVEIALGGIEFTLAPGGEMLIDRPAGDYLQLGAHNIPVTGAFLSQIWLKEP